MKEKISVIVPVYNVEKYLSKCINSIINQTYTNLEIILVDDGSTDNSGDICDCYASKDTRIKVIHKENGGLSDARNMGLGVATGGYVNFIDSDDYIHEKFHEVLMKLISSHNADIAQCDYLKIYEETDPEISDIGNNQFEKVTVLNNIEALNQLYNNLIKGVVWNKLYKRDLFKDIRFPKGKIHEDDFTTYKLLFNSNKIIITSYQLYYYLQRSNSIMGSKFNAKHLDSLEAFSNQILFFNKNELYDLKNKAIIKLENNIRGFMRKVLDSDLDNKELLFHYLVNYYRENFHYFKNNLNIVGLRKVIIYMIRYSPSIIVKILCGVLNIRDKITGINDQK
ncbi:glycosyltransferase [Neobacillus rhizophilus]|uniref:Glycosyltransferase n=1 Tax=Neobacillus rhizophilus TaxID=2833579 RepID=A0A942U738_9BACI|nr:glycosyltransferase [Neobacillus rhizophilus]MBS4212689.1 glycosyltransferase [Neobacillus rhizophilus]